MFEFKLILVLISALKWIIVSSNPIKFPGCQPDDGNCEDLNDLCEFIPLPHILCDREKIKQGCPRLCNNCPNTTVAESGNYHLQLYYSLKQPKNWLEKRTS